ncbi:type II toxin-antitoxin system RelE/ParE family toxin [Rhodoferax lacus]|uniref:Type II toxin-antitoxin system RelE/ParE family toxin n=1 Tax=Rhodoferax lacus TaxID=2184758 RepID=A0A3E1R7H2_9BURK|nr:type II toxin-antitoxin system RelE/ParE family toxin [Rhodoferax lacus]
MGYTLHPGAENDIAGALDFYLEHAGMTVAKRFLDEFERVAILLVQHPGFGTPTTRGRRSFPLKVFPYSVVYRVVDSEIRILLIRHQRQRPGYAGSRR